MKSLEIEYSKSTQVTGIKGILRECHVPVSVITSAVSEYAERENMSPEDLSLIVCCLEDIISVVACRGGIIIDGTDLARGEGPLSPTVCGTMTVSDVIDICYSGKTKEQILELCCGKGGFVSHFGTKDLSVIKDMISNGNKDAALVYEAMIYQVCKHIGEMAAALKGNVDVILLTGAMANDHDLTEEISEKVSFIGKITVC